MYISSLDGFIIADEVEMRAKDIYP
jgi:hypothetical protein